MGGVVLKLQLFCVSSEHRQNDEKMRGQERRLWELEKDSWQRGCMATVTDLGNSQNTEVFCEYFQGTSSTDLLTLHHTPTQL